MNFSIEKDGKACDMDVKECIDTLKRFVKKFQSVIRKDASEVTLVEPFITNKASVLLNNVLLAVHDEFQREYQRKCSIC